MPVLNLPNSKVLWPNTTLNVQECTEVPFPKALSAVEAERALGTRTQRLWRRFLIAWKNLLFRLGTKQNGPLHRRFFGKNWYTVRSIALFSFLSEWWENPCTICFIALFLLFDEIRSRLDEQWIGTVISTGMFLNAFKWYQLVKSHVIWWKFESFNWPSFPVK